MAQDYSINSYDPDNGGLSDLQNIEDNFECLRTLFAGATEPFPLPSQMFAGQPWISTTNKVFHIRNSANDAWLGVMIAPATQKIWVYRDSAMDGWLIDSVSATDCVISLKGGSQAYNYNGGNVRGTWTLPTTNFDHNHQWYDYIAAGTDLSWDIDGVTQHDAGGVFALGWTCSTLAYHPSFPTVAYYKPADSYTINKNLTINIGSSWRPYAAVGTLQYLNI